MKSKIGNRKSKISGTVAREKIPPGLMRLGDAAKAAGITVQQLQYYLMVGLVEPAQISAGHQRLFDQNGVTRMKMVRLLNDGGYPLREIRDIFLTGR